MRALRHGHPAHVRSAARRPLSLPVLRCAAAASVLPGNIHTCLPSASAPCCLAGLLSRASAVLHAELPASTGKAAPAEPPQRQLSEAELEQKRKEAERQEQVSQLSQGAKHVLLTWCCLQHSLACLGSAGSAAYLLILLPARASTLPAWCESRS